MNISKLQIETIDRIIAHEIYPKTEKKDAFAVTNSSLLTFDKSEKDILIKRVQEALSNTTKTFQLDYEDKSDDSIFDLVGKIKTFSDEDFISTSISLAEDLANAHFRIKIIGG